MIDKLSSAFQAGDPRLDGIQIAPVCPTTIVSLEDTNSMAINQNDFQADIAHMTVRGMNYLDLGMTTLSNTKKLIRGFFSDILISTNVEGERNQLIFRTERGTDNRMCLIFSKAHR